MCRADCGGGNEYYFGLIATYFISSSAIISEDKSVTLIGSPKQGRGRDWAQRNIHLVSLTKHPVTAVPRLDFKAGLEGIWWRNNTISSEIFPNTLNVLAEWELWICVISLFPILLISQYDTEMLSLTNDAICLVPTFSQMIGTFQKILPLSGSLKSLGLALSPGSALTVAGKFQISTMRGGGSSLRKCVHYVYRWSRLGRIWTYLEFRMIPVDYLQSLLAVRLQIIRGDGMEMLTVRSR